LERAAQLVIQISKRILGEEQNRILLRSHGFNEQVGKYLLRSRSVLDNARQKITGSVPKVIGSGHLKINVQAKSLELNSASTIKTDLFELQGMQELLNRIGMQRLGESGSRIVEYFRTISREVKRVFQIAGDKIVSNSGKVEVFAMSPIRQQKQKIVFLDRVVRAKDPEIILKQGFSLTYYNGKPITDTTDLQIGAEIRSRVYHGSILSTITKLEENHEQS
jgi:exodeoxyribonuclease VII large subunit